MPPEPFRLFIGDMHTNGKTALTTPSNTSNPAQIWLGECWEDMVKRAKSEARKKEFVLMLGGDLVDREGRDARKAAELLLQPLTDVASAVYGVPGTGYHVGEDGEEDRSIYDTVKANCKQWRRLEVGDKILDWAHHKIPVSKQPWNEFNGHKAKLEEVFWRCKYDGTRPPDLIVRHHSHRTPGIFEERGIKVVICPCWQLPNDFAAKVVDGILPTIGALAWWPMQNNRIEVWDYAIPEELAFA